MMRRNAGIVSSPLAVILGSVAVLGGLVWMLLGTTKPAGDRAPLVVYCAAGMRLPVSAVSDAFQKEFNTEIQLQYGGTGALLNNLRVAKSGDLYLAADESFINLARDFGLIDETIPLAKIRPVIAVHKGNPKKIQSIDDLLRDDVKFALATTGASIGKLTKKLLEKSGQWSAIEPKTTVTKGTVNDIALDVVLGTVDAAIVWDAIVRQDERLEIVRDPVLNNASQTVTIAVLKTCKQPQTALKFSRYLQAPKKGLKEWKRYGYEIVEGDAWSEIPKLTLFSGGVNRVAIENTLTEFQKREGVEINAVYNGCGVLVSMMKGGSDPDVYFACDTSYMVQVSEKFRKPITVAETDIVIIVPKGNPYNIQSLKDLGGTKEGKFRVGVTHRQKSALGKLTKDLLEELGLYESIEKHVVVEPPTADTLVNQLRVGALDAAIVYAANVSLPIVKESIEIIPITQGRAKAVQPIAIGKTSRHKYLAGRLVEALTSDMSRSRFETALFRWRVEAELP